MWQYTNSGTVDGISGRVDMNIAYKDYPAIIVGAAPVPTPVPSAEINTTTRYIVKPGDTLWAIAKRFLGDGVRYPQHKRLNGLESDTIYPGQVLKMPILY